MYFYTSQGETYSVNDVGHIGRPAIKMPPSGQWIMRGLVRFNNNGSTAEFRPFPKCFEIPHAELRFKNGKPRWFIADNDHGTPRVQMAGISALGDD